MTTRETESGAPDAPPSEAAATGVDTRDLSYAASAKTSIGAAVIRLVENATGRVPVLYRLLGYDRDVAAGDGLWDVMWRRFGLSLDLPGPGLANIPRSGPLVVVSNHPFGIADALTLCVILNRTRPDFKVVANAVFEKAPELRDQVLPISFERSAAAAKKNLSTRKAAIAHLRAGGCVALFPGGAVSAGAHFGAPPVDPEWKTFTARMIRETDAQVTPMFFVGRNGRLFHAVGHLLLSLRLGLYIHEFWKRLDRPVTVVIGAPVAPKALAERAGDARGLMDYLRTHTYQLSPEPIPHLPYGRSWD